MTKISALLSLLFMAIVFVASTVQAQDSPVSVADLRRELHRGGGAGSGNNNGYHGGWNHADGEQHSERYGMRSHNGTDHFGGDNGRDHPYHNSTGMGMNMNMETGGERWGGNRNHDSSYSDSDSDSDSDSEDEYTILTSSEAFAIQQDDSRKDDDELSFGTKAGAVIAALGGIGLLLLGASKVCFRGSAVSIAAGKHQAIAPVPMAEEPMMATAKPMAEEYDLEEATTSSETSN